MGTSRKRKPARAPKGSGTVRDRKVSDGTVRWQALWYEAGRQCSRGGFATEDAARAYLSEQTARLAGMRTDTTSLLPGAGLVTVDEYVDRFVAAMEDAGKLRPTTVAGYRAVLGAYVKGHPIAGRKVRDVRHHHVTEHLQRIRSQGLCKPRPGGTKDDNRKASPATVKAVRKALSALFRHAILERQHDGPNPVALVDSSAWESITRPTSTVLPDGADADDAAAAADDMTGWTWAHSVQLGRAGLEVEHGVAVSLAALTGARVAEVCGVQWRHVNLDDGLPTIRLGASTRTIAAGKVVDQPHGKTKDADRAVELAPEAVELLRAWRDQLTAAGVDVKPTSRVVVWTRRTRAARPGDPIRPENVRKALPAVCAAAGLPHKTDDRPSVHGVHRLRHAFTVVCLDEWHMTPRQVAALLGQASLVDTYSRHRQEVALLSRPGPNGTGQRLRAV